MNKKVSHPDLVVLGLLSEGPKHGYEIENRIETDKIRIWAKVGFSSIYHSLNKLEEKGLVSATPGKPQRGAGKFIYKITPEGRKYLDRQVTAALSSKTPVYSDRIAGMVFAKGLPAARQGELFYSGRQGLKKALETIRAQKARSPHPIAAVVLEFYETVLKAEQKALLRAAKIKNQPTNHQRKKNGA